VERTLVIADYILVLLSAGLGGISLLAFTMFLFNGSFNLVDLGLDDPLLLAWNLFLSLLFFFQHSLMIRKSFQRRFHIPQRYAGAVYSVSSSIPLLLVVLFWQESDTPLLVIQGPLRWALRGIFVLSILLMLWGVRSLGGLDTFGTGSLLAHMKGRESGTLPFSIRGPYRWVRHPLYSVVLLLVWSSPDVTLDRLWFNLTWTVWMVIGTVLEERDLVEEFGDAYREYQKMVPMLVPFKRPMLD
jgi:protein-S-isoprenylcysteine O-methyltransferase Ste14